jgi:hypothetical protein
MTHRRRPVGENDSDEFTPHRCHRPRVSVGAADRPSPDAAQALLREAGLSDADTTDEAAPFVEATATPVDAEPTALVHALRLSCSLVSHEYGMLSR